ncbi:YciI family protein [Amycolatopsis rhabdoformis]|uniref:YciI family protein n=1 Tax=Amycolatopsis rhabdoformis TaxID=1448059 RepID=A0ABZ1IJ00_9PSEU|nr:YciI family protein [Amycolatopsis rhabdoformis]WSE34134.1 YciI family protein [Amycolatopsis rhabdoformis]
MTDSTDQTVLTDLGLRLFQLYVFFGEPSEAWDLETDGTRTVLAEHVEYLRELERTGVMFMGGPFRAADYEWDGSGMIVVRAGSLAEARELAERDPLFVHGLRTYEVRGWQLNEGRLVLTVDLDSHRVGLA